VIGKEFWRTAVSELSPQAERAAVGASLMTLARKELIEPAQSTFFSEDAFKFRHILVRDAAYLGIPKETRADVHERYADWLDDTAGERAQELDEIIGYHLEQAHGYREELGPVGPGGSALATRAGERLAAAGRRAASVRGDMSAGANLISRAIEMLPEGHPERAQLLIELGMVSIRIGDFDRAASVLNEAYEAAAGDKRLQVRATIESEFLRSYTEPDGSALDDPTVADNAIRELDALGDDLGLARAWWLKSETSVNACCWGDRIAALDRALEHARRAGSARDVATLTALHAQALYFGPTSVPEALRRCHEHLEEHVDNRSPAASITVVIAGLQAMHGDIDEARGLHAQARAMQEELGERLRIVNVTAVVAAEIEELAGDAAAAAAILGDAHETLVEMGATSVAATIAAFRANALCLVGSFEEAAELAEVSRKQAPATDVVTQVLWRTARARAIPDGEELAREAVSIASETDYPELQARALACAGLVVPSGEERSAFMSEARRVYEAKGNVAAAARLPARSPAPS
jgi:tetratricopeptide (TPR) repeat protein